MSDLRLSELDKPLGEEAKKHPEYDPNRSRCFPTLGTPKELREMREELMKTLLDKNPQSPK